MRFTLAQDLLEAGTPALLSFVQRNNESVLELATSNALHASGMEFKLELLLCRARHTSAPPFTSGMAAWGASSLPRAQQVGGWLAGLQRGGRYYLTWHAERFMA